MFSKLSYLDLILWIHDALNIVNFEIEYCLSMGRALTLSSSLTLCSKRCARSARMRFHHVFRPAPPMSLTRRYFLRYRAVGRQRFPPTLTVTTLLEEDMRLVMGYIFFLRLGAPPLGMLIFVNFSLKESSILKFLEELSFSIC